jgi:microcompartment protein CcmK/EutM
VGCGVMGILALIVSKSSPRTSEKKEDRNMDFIVVLELISKFL